MRLQSYSQPAPKPDLHYAKSISRDDTKHTTAQTSADNSSKQNSFKRLTDLFNTFNDLFANVQPFDDTSCFSYNNFNNTSSLEVIKELCEEELYKNEQEDRLAKHRKNMSLQPKPRESLTGYSSCQLENQPRISLKSIQQKLKVAPQCETVQTKYDQVQHYKTIKAIEVKVSSLSPTHGPFSRHDTISASTVFLVLVSLGYIRYTQKKIPEEDIKCIWYILQVYEYSRLKMFTLKNLINLVCIIDSNFLHPLANKPPMTYHNDFGEFDEKYTLYPFDPPNIRKQLKQLKTNHSRYTLNKIKKHSPTVLEECRTYLNRHIPRWLSREQFTQDKQNIKILANRLEKGVTQRVSVKIDMKPRPRSSGSNSFQN